MHGQGPKEDKQQDEIALDRAAVSKDINPSFRCHDCIKMQQQNKKTGTDPDGTDDESADKFPPNHQRIHFSYKVSLVSIIHWLRI